MNFGVVILLAAIQGAAELLPVSSSAHVILVEKALGLGLQWLIEKVILGGAKGAAVEDLFGNLWLIGAALGAGGILILVSGYGKRIDDGNKSDDLSLRASMRVGRIQGLSLPFRGFSRSGATISIGLLSKMSRTFAEEFSFFLAVILTVPVVGREAWRLKHACAAAQASSPLPWLMGLLGLIFSFGAGLLAIRWLSSWLEKGRWSWFGVYCLAASVLILCLKGFGILV
jgi:undecaprenyl-diphosphatase